MKFANATELLTVWQRSASHSQSITSARVIDSLRRIGEQVAYLVISNGRDYPILAPS
jgi:hypothetical protein